MISWTLLARVTLPDGRQQLSLSQRGDEFSIRLSGHVGELMNSRKHASEEALARLACAGLAARPGARVLVGGLGMGFTLAAALQELGPDAEALVAELVAEVVDWNRGPLGACTGHPLADARTRVHIGDVARLIRTEVEAFDAILLDVDNGPASVTQRPNDWLYAGPGLAAARRCLRPRGVRAVWSAEPDAPFTRRLEQAGFGVQVETLRARPGKGARHTVWLARRSAS